MADDDGLAQYINTTSDGGVVPLVNTSNPVRWGAMAGAIVTSFVAAITTGMSTIILAARTAYLNIITGVTEFFTNDVVSVAPGGLEGIADIGSQGVEGLFPTITAAITEGSANLWRIDLSEYGIFAFPVAVAVVLMTLWVLQAGVTYAREEVF